MSRPNNKEITKRYKLAKKWFEYQEVSKPTHIFWYDLYTLLYDLRCISQETYDDVMDDLYG